MATAAITLKEVVAVVALLYLYAIVWRCRCSVNSLYFSFLMIVSIM